jgi:hypothetical protein
MEELMSHVVQAKTGIGLPQDETEVPGFYELLRNALDIIAQKYPGGEVCDYYKDYSNVRCKTSTGLAIKTQSVWRGIGLDINVQGDLVFTRDNYGRAREVQALETDLKLTIMTMMTVQCMEELGMVAEIEIDVQTKSYVAVGEGFIYA